jgi:hypothetical protein
LFLCDGFREKPRVWSKSREERELGVARVRAA